MPDSELREAQEPLKERYRRDPDAARVTLHASGRQHADVRSCSVDIGRAVYEAELHEGTGGPGAGTCSGDLLLGALAACAQLTGQAVADAFGLDAEIGVDVEGDLDLRGTLGMDEDAPVGFGDVRLRVRVEGEELDEETRSALRRTTERYCVVFQTLRTPPEMDTRWEFAGSEG